MENTFLLNYEKFARASPDPLKKKSNTSGGDNGTLLKCSGKEASFLKKRKKKSEKRSFSDRWTDGDEGFPLF